MTVWLVLGGRQAQVSLQQDLNLVQFSRIVGPGARDDLNDWLRNDFRVESTAVDYWWFFDQVMLIADENDAFLIDLSGNLTIRSEEITYDTAIVSAEVSGIAGEVEFHLWESATGRWQIEQVFVPESDEGPISWPAPLGSN